MTKTRKLRIAVDASVLIEFFDSKGAVCDERLLLLCGEVGEMLLFTSPFELAEVENYLVEAHGLDRDAARSRIARLEEFVSSKFSGGFRARLDLPGETSLTQGFLVDVACANCAQVLVTEDPRPYESLGTLAMTPLGFFKMIKGRYGLDYSEVAL